MSIRDFYLKFVSGGERNLLFVALRRLSLLENPRIVFATGQEQEPSGWPIWEESGRTPGAA
jgi:hypothetical protein